MEYIEWTALGIKRIVFIFVETRTKATKVLSRETNAILFYATKIIRQIHSGITDKESWKTRQIMRNFEVIGCYFVFFYRSYIRSYMMVTKKSEKNFLIFPGEIIIFL